jgi:hypothetical protein
VSVADFHSKWASARRVKFVNADVCPTCGSKLEHGFGLAGGGFGPYTWCGDCDFFAKRRLPDGDE